MQVNKIQSNSYSNVRFTGSISGLNNAIIVNDDKLGPKAIKLIHALDDQIERAWKDIKTGKLVQESPFFVSQADKKWVTVRPVYTQKYPAVLFEVEDGKYFEKILVNRKKPSDFRYEKNVYTEHGSATLKTYNSAIENDYELNNHVDDIISKSVKDILHKNVYLEHFDIEAFKSDHDSLLFNF